MNRNQSKHDNIIHQMAQFVLRDILASVIEEFETATGSKIGSVRIDPKDKITDRRRIDVHIQAADSDSLIALMRYKKMLCEHEPLKSSGICSVEEN